MQGGMLGLMRLLQACVAQGAATQVAGVNTRIDGQSTEHRAHEAQVQE